MAARPIIDVTRLIDEQKIGPFNILITVLSFLTALSEGFDMQAAALAAPGLVRAWHLDREALGPVFSASPLGMLVGSAAIAWLADRFGRKGTIIGCCLLYGLVTLVAAIATSLDELVVLRFITGLGLGGLLPVLSALNAEFAPKRIRATMIVLMGIGITVGAMMPAAVTAVLGQNYTWQAVFVIGGAIPVVLAVFLFLLLPESIKFQVARQRHDRVARLVARLRPDLAIGPGTTFIIGEPASHHGAPKLPVQSLFRDGLATITLLLWVVWCMQLLVSYFLHSWMPILFRDAGLSIREMGIATSLYDFGGLFGAIFACRLMDKRGMLALGLLYSLACPLSASIGNLGSSVTLISISTFATGFCMVGTTQALIAAVVMIYPTIFRASGAGWANTMGRLGAMTGPMIGAVLLSMHFTGPQLFLAPAIPLAIAALCSFVLMRLCYRRFGGYPLDEAAARVTSAPAVAFAPSPATRKI